MESLALMVSVILSIMMLSGPINIGLTSRRVQEFCALRPGFTVARRLFCLVIAIIGIYIAIIIMYQTSPVGPAVLSLIAVGGNVYALKREIDFAKSR